MDKSANTKGKKADRTCFVPGCTSGYKSNKSKLTLFCTPKDKNQFEKWLKIIPRADKDLDQYSVVCESHFDERFIERYYKYIIEGKEVLLPRTRPSLTADAFPSIFPNLPKYISKKLAPARSPKIRDGAPLPPKKRKRDESFECSFSTPAPDDVFHSNNVELTKVLDNVPSPSKWCKITKPQNNIFLYASYDCLSLDADIEKTMNMLSTPRAPAILEDADNPDWAPSLNLGHDYFDGKRKLRKRNDKNSKKCPCLCDADDGHKKHKREDNSSKKNIVIDNKTSSANTAAVRMKSIQSEIPMSSSEATMSSSESRTSYTSNFSALMKKYPRKSRYCRFRGCTYTSDFIGVHFYRFPKEEKRCRAWVKACKNDKLIGIPASELHEKAHLCMYHFQDWCFVNTTSRHRLVHNAIPCCSKLNATKKLASAKVSNCTDSTATNVADNNSSVLKQLLIPPVSSQASSTVSEESSSDSREIPLVRIESGNSTILRYIPPDDAPIKTSQSEDASSTTPLDSSSDSDDIPLIPIISGNSTILRYFPPEDSHIRTIQSEGASSTIVSAAKMTSADFCSRRVLLENSHSAPITSKEVLLTAIKSEDTFADVNSSENTQKNKLSENDAELVQSTCTDSFSKPSNSSESEHVNCVTHAEAFIAAKTLLHYLMNQNDVDNPDINFILNLTKKIKRRLPVKKEPTSENS